MTILRKMRFSLGTIMMIVAAAGAASALFAKVRWLLKPDPEAWSTDIAAMLVIAVGLTAAAIAAARRHSASQAFFQMAITCVLILSLIWAVELPGPKWATRAARYWFQAAFLATVVAPLFAYRLVLDPMEPGPRREWWKKTGEAVVASFANMILILLSGIIQVAGVELLPQLVKNAMTP